MKPKKQKRASRNVPRRAHIERLKEGADAWNAWSAALREQGPDWRADLRDADLPGILPHPGRLHPWFPYRSSAGPRVDLRRAILSGANLKGADLSCCDLRAAKFRGADLEGAYLEYADLRRANFDKANLENVRLNYAKLRGAQFLQTRVDGAQFAGSRMGNTYFVDVKLDGASGLEEVNHYGPSHLSLGTLTQSGGRLPPSFLRGCGVAPLVQVMLGGDRTERDRAFAELHANGLPVELPRRYLMYLFHGWRARRIHRDLNKHTEFSWNLFNLASVAIDPGRLDHALRAMKKHSTIILLVNPYRYYSKERTILKRLERARRGRRLKALFLEWHEHQSDNPVKHHCIDLYMGRDGLSEGCRKQVLELLE
jgi:uncharacterized protein YjbI with pentapeptide repeats